MMLAIQLWMKRSKQKVTHSDTVPVDSTDFEVPDDQTAAILAQAVRTEACSWATLAQSGYVGMRLHVEHVRTGARETKGTA